MLDGPQYLNNMDSILTRWRFFQYCGYSDITTAYHKILSNKKDQALRKIWVKKEKFGKEYNEPWIVAYPKALQFGDKLAGSFCQLAIFDCAERFMIPENAQQLKENILMDDILIGADSMDIKEFFCFPAQIAHLPIGKEIPKKMIFINIIHHLLNPFI